ncbi:MAG: PQQ-like beta-propeller repeat protein [Phycisphaerales bacterium]|jgi:outer membrane protein assembly factor BamB|nr:PQQ-like beta-propeller repeat protein [Phycisphaerales bacterium]
MADRNLLSIGGRLGFTLAMMVVGLVVSADAAPKLVGSPEADWPQWRGPLRDSISSETGLLNAWPKEGPKQLWKLAGMGKGWCSPIIAGKQIFIVGDVGSELKIFALSLDGKINWSVTNGKAWKRSFPGGRAACCYSEGKIYHVNGPGRLVCLDAKDGKELWTVNILERFGAKVPTFGISECLLIDGDNIIVTPGGKKATLAALNKKTGATVWSCSAPPEKSETAGYSSPILVNWGGKRVVIASTSYRTLAVEADSGKLLWTETLTYTEVACSTIPVLCGELLFISNTSFKEQLSSMLKVSPECDKASKKWSLPVRTTCGSSLYVDGNLYIAGSRGLTGLLCLDAKTGKVKAKLAAPIDASMLYADGKLFIQSADGKVLMVKPAGDALKTLGSFELVKVKGKRKDAWTHPVLLNGKLYLRYHDTLYCYDVKGK